MLKIHFSSFNNCIFLALSLWFQSCKYFSFIHVFLTIHHVIHNIGKLVFFFFLNFFISVANQNTLSSHFCLTLQVFNITKSASFHSFDFINHDCKSSIFIFSLSAAFIAHQNVCIKYFFIVIIDLFSICAFYSNIFFVKFMFL